MKRSLNASLLLSVALCAGLACARNNDSERVETVQQAVNAPSHLGALLFSTTDISLSWSDSCCDADVYRVFRRFIDGSDWHQVCSDIAPGVGGCHDTTTQPGNVYEYFVYGFNFEAQAYSDPSNDAGFRSSPG